MQDSTRLGLEIRCDNHFTENFTDRPRQWLIKGSVANDDSAEGRLFIRSKRLVPCLAKIVVRTHSAWVRMLQDRDGWLFEFANQVCGRANVQNVVKREFLPMKFFEIFVEIAVERAGLVRIFPVTQSHRQWKRQ